MNYENIYDQIISRAKSEFRRKGLDIYYEKHHIIPRCIGGSNDDTNLVLLTAREHFIAHKLLCEIYPNNKKLHYALWRMMNPQNKNHIRTYNISNIEYERRKHIQQQYVQKLGLQNKNRLISSEQKHKISKSLKGRTLTDETKIKISKSLKGRTKVPMLEKTKEILSKSMLGKNKGKPKPPRTKEHCNNLSLAHKNRPKIFCPYCDCSSTNKTNMKRYHFDNCKKK